MPRKSRAALALCLVLSSGCMSLAPRNEAVSASALLIEGVPARGWSDNRCAAGALSEVLNYLGDPVTEQELSPSLTRARHGGVVTVDLLIAARNRGYDAQLLRGDSELVQRELEQRHPLILMLRVMDAPGTQNDLFHYVVLSGADSERGRVRMHYGDTKKRWVSLGPLESSWAAAGHATFLIGPKRKRIATDDDLRRAVVLEDAGKISQAIALYRSFLDSHPESSLGWTNLGNAHASRGERELAEVAYRNALFLGRENRDALNNLASLLLGQNRLDEAEAFARRAADQDGTDRSLVLDTLARILFAKGDCVEAGAIVDEVRSLISKSDPAARADIESALARMQRECASLNPV